MALDKTVLGALIKTKLTTALPGVKDDPKLTLVCNAIGEAVVSHIQTAAAVTGVVGAGPASGSPVTGTVS